MRVFVTGATGFVGRALLQRLIGEGHSIVAWVRDARRARNRLGHGVELLETSAERDALAAALGRCDTVVNLAGENIMAARWTRARKRALRDSRVQLTERLVEGIASAQPRPRVLVSASAVGYYGDRGDQELSEGSTSGHDFLAALCRDWERAALAARELGCRVVTPRLGIVLGADGGALAAMLPAFRLGLGGPLGSGQQYVAFIHIDDLLDVLLRCLEDPRLSGPINATARHPVTSRRFARALGAALGRPALLRVPAFALRALLGARARAVLMSQCALPDALLRAGHRFRHPEIEGALAALTSVSRSVRIRRLEAAEPGAPAEACYVLEHHSRLAVGEGEAFAFFSRAQNLGLITPSWMHFEILGQPPDPMCEGAQIQYRIRLGPLPIRWRTVIERWHPPHGFVDLQEKGPYRLWRHEHFVHGADGAHSTMLDRVYYSLPFGPLGTLAHALWVRRSLSSIFSYRADAIARLFGG